MPESATAKSAQAPVGSLLSARIGLARAAVFWERCWPEFAAALGVLGVFVAAALFDLPEMVPGWVHAGALALLAALLVVAIWQGVRALRFPGESEGRRRIASAWRGACAASASACRSRVSSAAIPTDFASSSPSRC